MRFIKNLYRSALAVVAGALALTSCQPEESPLSRAIMTSVSGMQFAAQNAEPQTITVYADAEWTVEAPEWVTVDKTEGNRTMEVTISVGDNMRDGALDNPKKDTIVFRGYNLLAHAYVIVMQDGDKYRDVVPATISEVLSMKDEEVVVLDDVAVVALSSDGFVVNDGNESVFVSCTEPVTVGDCVDVWGSKGTMNGVPAVTICDDLKIERNFAVVYPLVNDITATIDTYAPSKLEYVELAGSLDGVNVLVEGATKVGALLAHSSVDLAALNGHNLIVRGFSFGATASLVNIIPVEIVDLGVNEIIYFTDNFDWVAELADAAGAGDSMGVDGDDSAKNAYTAVEGFAELLASQGYEDLFPSSKTIYLQKNYLKFSKGSNVNGIRFPAVAYGGTTNVVLTFDWGVHVGSGGQDETELMIEIEGNGVVDRETFTHTAGEWVWQTETVTISGIDDNSRIVLKPTTFVGEVSSGYYRWYLDNIKIVQGEGEAPVPGPGAGGSSVFSDNFDWVQPFVEADIAKGGTQGDSMLDNAQYTVGSSYNLEGFEAAFTEQGYEALFPDSKAIYVMQGNYLKFSKGKNTNGIRLPVMDFGGATTVELSFDWGINIGSGGPDDVKLEVEVEGNGNINGASKSSPLIHSAGDWEWQTEVVTITGVDNETRITIKPTTFTGVVDASGYYRWFLDNVNVNVK